MTFTDRIERLMARIPHAAAILYVALVVALLVGMWGALSDILDQRAAVADAADTLAKLESRMQARPNRAGNSAVAVPAGSPFLEGATVTVAGAALMQRVADAVARAGGAVASSQVELQGAQAGPQAGSQPQGLQAKAGVVGVTANFEAEQPAIQKILYDLEAGMPFVFVDQLVIQAPLGAAAGPNARMRVLLGVSAQWQGGNGK
jgi:general secretion pathway protein M